MQFLENCCEVLIQKTTSDSENKLVIDEKEKKVTITSLTIKPYYKCDVH